MLHSFVVSLLITHLLAPLAPPAPAWSAELDNRIRFQRPLDERLLLVGTERHLFALDAQSGKQLWRFRNLSVAADNILVLPEFEMLIVNEGWGGHFSDRESSVLGVGLNTGQLLWESPTIKERIVAVAPDLDNNRVLMIGAQSPHGKDRDDLERALRLYMLATDSGRVFWQTDLEKKIRLTPRSEEAIAERAGEDKLSKFHTFDLSGYHPPLFYGDKLLVMLDGLRCYNLASGRLIWRKQFDVFEGDLARSYAEPVVEQNVLFVAGEGTVRAFQLEDGVEIWKSSDYGVVTDLHADDRWIYGRLGGMFYDFDDDEWKNRGPFGIVALERRTGRKIWKWDNGDDSITNLLIAGERVYLADEDDLIALDRKTGKEIFKRGHDFARPPRFLGLNESEQLVLVGDEDAAGLGRENGKKLWSHHLEPPGVSVWKKLAGGFLATTGALLTVGSYAVSLQRNLLPAAPSLVNRVVNYRNKLIRLGRAAGKGLIGNAAQMLQRSRYAQLDGTHQYFFTRLPGGQKGLLGVNLNRGVVDQAIALKESHLQLVVNEAGRKVFQVEGPKLQAFDLAATGPLPQLRKR